MKKMRTRDNGAGRLSRRARIVLRGLLVVIGIGFGLGASEVAVRMFSEEGSSLLVKEPAVGQRYLPGFEGDRYVPEAGRVVHLRFNRDGFRGPERSRAKPPGANRIAVMGDSFIAAVAVDEPDTLAGQLEGMMDGIGGRKWEVLNFGVSGYGTAQSLLAWRRYASAYHPDLVILCFYNGNDLSDNHPDLSTAHRPYFRLNPAGELAFEAMSEARAGASRRLAEYSQLYVWQKNQMRRVRDRLRSAAKVLPPGFQIFNTDPKGVYAEAWDLTERLIVEFAREVEAAGSNVLVVSIPAHEQLMPERWRAMIATLGNEAATFDADYPEQRLGRLCEQNSIPFLPLRDLLRDECASRVLHFASEGHFNEDGNSVAAEAIQQTITASVVESIGAVGGTSTDKRPHGTTRRREDQQRAVFGN